MTTSRSGDDLLQLAESRPLEAISAAEETIVSTGGRERIVALRAKGIACRTVGDIGESIRVLEVGLKEAIQLNDPQLHGELEMSLAPSLAYAGDVERAVEILVAAEHRLDAKRRAQAMTQRAGLIARMGDLRESLELFEEAEPVLMANNDRRWLANLSSNRGLVQTYIGSFAEAERDLQRARSLYTEEGEISSAAEMTQNLGFLAMQRGDIAEALQFFDDAEPVFQSVGIPIAELQLDRAAALQLVGLFSEASRTTNEVVKGAASSDDALLHGESLVAHAMASALSGDFETAIQAASRALALFEDHGRTGWQSRALYLRLLALMRSGEDVHPRQLISVAKSLEKTGQTFQSLHAHLLAGVSALGSGEGSLAAQELGYASRIPSHSPIDIRIQGALAEALLRDAAGDDRGAAASVRTGVRLLDEYRSTLGATESRVNVVRHADDLYTLGTELAFRSGRPSQVLGWIGRTRSSSMRIVSPTSSAEPELADALATLRMIQTDRREAELEGRLEPDVFRSQAEQEQRVRRLALKQSGGPQSAGQPVSLAELQKDLTGRAMVVLAERDSDLIAIRVRERSIRMTTLASAADIYRETDHLGRAMRSLAVRPDARSSGSTLRNLDAAATILDQLLFEPLKLRDEGLVIVPTPRLHAMPWGALPTTRDRAYVVSPSPFIWHDLLATVGRSKEVVLVAGPELAHANTEVERLSVLHRNVTALTGDSATVGNVLEAMNEADVVHFASHARFRADNAMFSSLRLADGDLTLYELERIGRVPATVILSACDSGLSENAAAEELMGLATVLASMGAASLVVSVAPVPDAQATVDLMTGLHERLADGNHPSDALRLAGADMSGGDPTTVVARNAFVCMGSR